MHNINILKYEYLLNNNICNTPILNDESLSSWGQNLDLVYNHYNSYLSNIQLPNSCGPIERHPYLDLYANDFNLNRNFLLLGTFPPSTYFNNLPLNNLSNLNIGSNFPLNYFYGNTKDLWYYLFNLNNDDITLSNIQRNLEASNISISDVFSFVQRKIMISPSDSEYVNISSNKCLKNIFNVDSKIHTLLFTSGNLRNLLNNNVSSLTGFRWVLEDCFNSLDNFTICGNINGEGEYYSITNYGIQNSLIQQNGGIIWWLKSANKKLRIINLPTPSDPRKILSSSFFLKWLNFKAINNGIPLINENLRLNNYLSQYPNVFTKPYTKQYRSEIYQMVLNNTIQLL